MSKIIILVFIGCALVAVNQAQDLTMLFQAMGMDAPILPPQMPSSLRRALYPRRHQQQQQLQQQRKLLLQRQLQQQMAARQSQQVPKTSDNPYSVSYRASIGTQPRSNSVYSPANMIRRPGTVANAAIDKSNPYSQSRASGSRIPSVRNNVRTPMVRPSVPQSLAVMQRLQKIQQQPKKIKDAKLAGCKLPVDNTAASVLMFNDCRNPVSRMVCEAELMQCMNVGVAAMCCPVGMNRLAMDTLTYVQKMQRFMAEVA